MKLTRTTVVIPLAGLLLVGAAGAVAATSGDPASTPAIVAAAPSATPSPSAGTVKQETADTVLTDVLDALVTKGTISAAQKTAILDAVGTERTTRREARQAARQQLKDFLADGVITQEEFNKLPADSRLRTAATLMDDGKITIDELRSLGRGLLGGGRGHGTGPGMGQGGGRGNHTTPAPSAPPSTGG